MLALEAVDENLVGNIRPVAVVTVNRLMLMTVPWWAHSINRVAYTGYQEY